MRMARVNRAAKTPMTWEPNTLTAAAPAMDAPAVLAMVFRVRMAVMGFSISVRSLKRSAPEFLPSRRRFSTALQGTE